MTSEADSGPWYRHFWPWFLVVLMVLSMAASLATVVMAVGLGDLSVTSEAEAGTGIRAPVEAPASRRD